MKLKFPELSTCYLLLGWMNWFLFVEDLIRLPDHHWHIRGFGAFAILCFYRYLVLTRFKP